MNFNSESMLYILIDFFKKQGENLENPSKESHEGKPLLKHIRECLSLSSKILYNLGIADDLSRQICSYLCIVHDIGKLDPRWQLGKRKRIAHAKRGGELLWKYRDRLEKLLNLPREYASFLALATLKHHSSLFINQLRPEEIAISSELSSVFSGNKIMAITLADLIGIFKLADIISALNIDYELVLSQFKIRSDISERLINEIRRWAEQKCGFDSIKYETQSKLASSKVKHLIIAAPTGWGKTALALLRIQYMNPTKVFYVLPTITAIKDFEGKLRRVFGSEYVGEYFYFADVEYLLKKEEPEKTVYPIDFYRYFIPKIMVTTIDQVLLTTLQFGKYHLRRFNFRRALLVFDEFHLLTSKMVGALKAVFNTLHGIYNFSTIFMTATPSIGYIATLNDILEGHGGLEMNILKQEYKRLKRHNINVVDLPVIDFLQENLNELFERSTLIILNTVDRAVQVYDFLREELGNRKVYLIHSRFTYDDRRAREEDIRNARILVSTQVSEVSLDISYGNLITELAPIPSLIQRFGRVNRYGEWGTLGGNVYICRQESEKPYSYAEFIITDDILPELINGLRECGEETYLKVVDKYYEELISETTDEIERACSYAERALDIHEFFYRLKTHSPEEIFGREPSYLAVPSCYLTRVKQLKQEMNSYKDYYKRKELLARLKSYFISVPEHIIERDGRWDDELNLYTVGFRHYIYSSQKGLVRRS